MSNQPVAGSIIVTHIKSISVPSLPLRVYGLMRSTHRVSQGFKTTSFVGSLPYFCWCLLLTWHLWHFLRFGQNVAIFSNTLQHGESLLDVLFPDVAGSGDTILLLTSAVLLE